MYKEALDVLDCVADDTDESADLKVAVNQNIAMCFNSLNDFESALFHCDLALALKPESAKAFFIKSQVFRKQQEFSQAIDCLKQAIRQQPNDRKLRSDLEDLKEEAKQHNQSFG